MYYGGVGQPPLPQFYFNMKKIIERHETYEKSFFSWKPKYKCIVFVLKDTETGDIEFKRLYIPVCLLEVEKR